MRRAPFVLIAAACLPGLAAGRARGAENVAGSSAGGEGEGERCVKGEGLLQSKQVAKQMDLWEDGGPARAAAQGEVAEGSEGEPAGSPGDPSAEKEMLLASGGERAPLSPVGCSGCVCHGINALKCGWSFVTNIWKCGKSLFPTCGWHGSGWWKKWKCEWNWGAKSCEVPNECDFEDSFSSCLASVANSLGLSGKLKQYMNMLTETGCSSLDTCKDKVMDGISPIIEKVTTALKEGTDAILEKTGMKKVIEDVTSKVDETVEAVNAKVEEVGQTVQNYIADLNIAFWEKYDLGDMCMPSPGVWSLSTTDCGAFDDLGKIFSDFGNVRTHFSNAKEKFVTCLKMKGFLDVPTPFIKIGWKDFCLPPLIVTALEYIVGAFVDPSAVVSVLAENLNKVGNSIKETADKIDLAKIGQHVLDFLDPGKVITPPSSKSRRQRRRKGSRRASRRQRRQRQRRQRRQRNRRRKRSALAQGDNGTSAPALAQEADTGRRSWCPIKEWSVTFSFRIGVTGMVNFGSSIAWGPGATAGMAFQHIIGCKNGTLMWPTVAFGLDLQGLVNILGAKTGLNVGIKIAVNVQLNKYPHFTNRTLKPPVAVGLLVTTPFPVLGPLKFDGSYSIAIKWNDTTNRPIFSLPWGGVVGFKMKLGSFLQQISEEATAVSEEAHRIALGRGSNPALAAFAGSIHALAGRRSDLAAAMADALPPHGEILEQVKAQVQHKEAMLAALELAQRRMAGTEEAPDPGLSALQGYWPVELRVKGAFNLCLHGFLNLRPNGCED